MKSDLVEIRVDLLVRGDRAVQVRDHNTGKTVWLPLSQIELTHADEDGLGWVVDLPEWLAIEKELV
ncbi:hypothetical protein [Xanthobacter flavus]|uniref:hypothetical protein n=1 Tax=Xanthobacter flavus TaxID=281 RepID=UPI0037266EDC